MTPSSCPDCLTSFNHPGFHKLSGNLSEPTYFFIFAVFCKPLADCGSTSFLRDTLGDSPNLGPFPKGKG